jgi:hypothetical protein
LERIAELEDAMRQAMAELGDEHSVSRLLRRVLNHGGKESRRYY